jgi:hypothetical protein
MGIDSIGKKGPPTPPLPADVPGAARPAGGSARPFEVSTAGADPAPRAGAVDAPRTALDRLRAGEIDVNGYVDVKVREATAHLAVLPPGELEPIRAALRDRLASDPGLVELVRKATGAVPQPPSDD